MERYRIILADDHVLLRQGLKKLIEEKQDLVVVGDVGDGLALLGLLKRTAVHLVILDISMPNLRGIEATCEIKRYHPGVKVLVLTMHKDGDFLGQALAAGADGYLLKDNADVELFSAVENIRQGKRYVSPIMAGMLKARRAEAGGSGKTAVHAGQLSFRERQILKLISDGCTSRQIAERLFISARTVEHHRAHIMHKLCLRKTAELVRYAVNKGYA